MNTDELIDHPDGYDPQTVGTEKWVRDAIAQQAEHIKRSTSCSGQVGRAHAWRTFGRPGVRASWQACIVCDVTRTDEDYRTRLRAARTYDGPEHRVGAGAVEAG